MDRLSRTPSVKCIVVSFIWGMRMSRETNHPLLFGGNVKQKSTLVILIASNMCTLSEEVLVMVFFHPECPVSNWAIVQYTLDFFTTQHKRLMRCFISPNAISSHDWWQPSSRRGET